MSAVWKEVEITPMSYTQLNDLLKKHFLEQLPEQYRNLLTEEAYGLRKIYEDMRFDGFCALKDFDELRRFDRVSNFLYWRDAGIVFLNIYGAGHARFMAIIENMYKLCAGEEPQGYGHTLEETIQYESLPYWFRSAHDSQEKYLKLNRGIYKSSCGNDVYRHKDFKFTRPEAAAFQDSYRFHVYDY